MKSILPFTAIATAAASCQNDTAPIVDLGYAVQQAGYNATGDYYTFNDIRFADPPPRFSKPQFPTTVDRTVNNGTTSHVCPFAVPFWAIEGEAITAGLTPQELQELLYSSPSQEDCLFLDVAVSRATFEQAASGSSSTNGSAVMIWVYGGGYVGGSKDNAAYNPAGLIAASQVDDQEGVIIVKINYRLGLFGWLGQGDGVTPNVGLYDQRLAFEWVQKYIHLFGGDPNRLTIFGESAGAGSIEHHITAYGGDDGAVPFQQAILQSPGFSLTLNASAGYYGALEAASALTGTPVTTTAQLAALNESTLIEVNRVVVNNSMHGGFTYGPVPDGDYVPDYPIVLLGEGKVNRGIKVMPGHNRLEGQLFIFSIDSDAEFRQVIQESIIGVSNATVDYIATQVYPDDLSGTYGYTTETERFEVYATESDFTCNTRSLGTAFNNQTYNYIFTYGPAYHGQDVGFTWFDGNTSDSSLAGTVIYAPLALEMQQRFTRFAQTGNPNSASSTPQWPEYGANATLLDFDITRSLTPDDAANSRCTYWQSGAWRP